MENNNILNNLEAIRNEIGNRPTQQRIDEIFNYCIE